MNAVAQREEQAVQHVEPASEVVAVMSMIERAARDPSVDIDKFRQLMEMRKEIEAMAAEREFDAAMTEAQSEMRPIAADANNSQTKSKYATYAALDRALRPIYTKHGFSLGFDTADGAPEGYIRVVCKVAHNGGHRAYPHIDMPADGKGAKGGDVMTKTHATGSAVSYGRRYLLGMIFNIAVGEDDDGNAAGTPIERIGADQAKVIRDLIAETGADIEKFCQYLRVEAIPDLPVRDFERAVALLNQKKRGRT